MFPQSLSALSPNSDIQTFNVRTPATGGTCWQTWQKPIGKTMAQMFVVGGAGGGAGGGSGTTVGGGGGAGGGVSLLRVPLYMIPDRLYIQVGAGGAGGAAGGAGGVGLNSYIYITQNNLGFSTLILRSQGGGAGQSSPTGNGGAAPGATSTVICVPSSAGKLYANDSPAGRTGGSVSAGQSATALSNIITCPGAGGGGGANAGGDITGAGLFQTALGGAGSAVIAGGAGINGITFQSAATCFAATGGSGGGGSSASTGGAGGNGGMGSGGGGGGSGSTGGVGGKGGDGIVIIWCF